VGVDDLKTGLEEGAIDPDEVEPADEPLVWDEGADDE
jgi:hypothetical protein